MFPHPISDHQFFDQLMQVLGGAQGAGFSVLGLVLVKWLVVALEWRLGDMVGVWKLTAISALTVATTILAQTSTGVPVTGAVCNGAVFAALSVFGNNFVNQWRQRHEDRANIKFKKTGNSL